VRILTVGKTAKRDDPLLVDLRTAGHAVTLHATDESSLRAGLDAGPWDLVLVHHPDSGLDFAQVLAVLREIALDLPVVVLTERPDVEETAAFMRAGARDVLFNPGVDRLRWVLEREVQAAQDRQARREGASSYQTLVEEIPALIYMAWADDMRRTMYVSPQLKAMTGFSPGEWLAEPESWLRRLHPEDRERVLSEHRESCRTDQPFRSEYRILDIDGLEHWWHDEGRVLRGSDNRPQFVRGFVVDITERKRAEETILQMTYRDAVTGLPNRTLFLERLQAALAGPRQDTPLALLILALDRLREIRNTLGHGSSEAVVRETAHRLADLLGEKERVARLRGDEFAVLVPGADAHLAQQLGVRMLKTLEAPFVVEKLPIELGGRVGIAVAPTHGRDPEMLLRRADIAVEAAREDYTGCVVYSTECDPYDPLALSLLGELRRALEADQLMLHYQPKVDLRSRSVIGAEALLRWHHPKRGPIGPQQFIPLAEQGGLIRPLTRWVLKEALGQCHTWHEEGRTLPVAVNLSARNLHDPQLADEVAALLEGGHLVPGDLLLELTESAVMADPIHSADTLRRLKDQRVKLSIDDFGTGYSSLSYLRTLPVSELKIDKSFVLGITGDGDEDTVIVRSTTDLGHNLGLTVVAEGVENNRTLELLTSFGCDAAQGFFIAKPMSGAALSRWLETWPGDLASD
jgi:diguanylate cyclase (GGDEF)-like protein/PAS domain S-box-containing protein